MCAVDKPIFFVTGATGTGKSKVAVELAILLKKQYSYDNVVIINCDVSQFYVDLPIATNMSRSTELCGIKHVFMGFLSYDNKLLHQPEDAFVGCDLMPTEECTCSQNVTQEEPEHESITESVTFNIIKYIERVETYIRHFFAEHDHSAVIVCGGTCYYLQALLFDGMLTLETNQVAALNEEEEEEPISENAHKSSKSKSDEKVEEITGDINTSNEVYVDDSKSNNDFNDKNISNCSYNSNNKSTSWYQSNALQAEDNNEENAISLTTSVWDRLNAVDPLTAKRYHPNDTRRIQRLLDIHKETGRPPSEIFAKRDVKLRWNAESLFVIWTDIERKLLTRRLNERVDDMVSRGLFSEVYLLKIRISSDEVLSTLTKAIGFKELRNVLTVNDVEHARLGEQYSYAVYCALNEMKVNTHHYARQQIRWIKNRILPLLSDAAERSGNVVIKEHVVRLDLTCGTQQHHLVEDVAKIFCCKSKQSDTKLENAINFPLLEAQIKIRPPLTRHICDDCGALIYGDEQIIIHKQSQRHRRAMKRLVKRNEHDDKLLEKDRAQKCKKEESNLESTGEAKEMEYHFSKKEKQL